MEQNEQALQFNRQLDRLLAGKALDAALSPTDQRAIEFARRLSLTNFSSESSIRDTLHVRLLEPLAIGTKPQMVSLFQLNFSTWASTALVIIILLINSIGAPVPHSTFIATNLPAPFLLTTPSRSAITPSLTTTTQVLKPVPVPTPLASSAIAHAQNKPALASNSSNQSWFRNPGQTQTPKPDLLPNSDARP